MKSITGILAATFLSAGVLACYSDSDRPGDAGFSAQDSVATAGEIRASLEGGTAPGKQSYLYRGLYAGMTRAALEGRIRASSDTSGRCAPITGQARDVKCSYDAVIGADSAQVAITATFTSDPHAGSPLAREITVTRQLPIAVDGVRVAKGLSDAFAAQTVLLDRREATYGHHAALVRMGTMRGERENYATVTVADKHGREELTVTLTRSGAAAVKAAPAPPAAAKGKAKGKT
jgi:hypothetical protein